MRTSTRVAAALGIVGLVGLAPGRGACAKPDSAAPVARTAIEGRVIRGGAPVTGLRVEIRFLLGRDANPDGITYLPIVQRLIAGPDAWAPVATPTTDADGRFAAPVSETGVYDVQVLAADGAVANASVTVPVRGAHVEASLELPAATRPIEGRVVTISGKPFQGRLLWMTAETRKRHQGLTLVGVPVPIDEEGRFKVSGVHAGSIVLAACDPGRSIAFSEPIDTVRGLPALFAADDGFSTLTVHVVDDATGAPIPEAVVLGQGDTSGGGHAKAIGVADGQGVCTIRAVSGAAGSLWAYRDGYQEAGNERIFQRSGSDVEVRLPKAARIVGRVVSAADGKPVAGVEVHAAPRGKRGIDWPQGHAVTDAAGRYAIEGAQSGGVTVFAEGPGWVTADFDDAEARKRDCERALSAGETAIADLRVVAAGLVRGKVLSADGKPVVGAVVRATTGGRDTRRFVRYGEDTQARAVVATDEGGRFTLDRFAVGESIGFEITAVGATRFVGDATARAPAQAQDLEIRLLAPVARVPLEVTVVDAETGSPLPNAAVEVLAVESDDDSVVTRVSYEERRWKGTTGADGKIRTLVIDDRRWVRVALDGYVGGGVFGTEKRPFESSFTIRMARPVRVSGHVFLPDGTPAAGQVVELHARDPYDADEKATADAQGAFTFTNAPPGEVDLAADVAGTAGAKAMARGGATDVVLRIVPRSPREWNAHAPPLAIRVEDADGHLVPYAWATVHAAHEVVLREPVEDGVAVARGFAKDSPLKVRVTDARDCRGRRLPLASATADVAPGVPSVVVRLAAGKSIEGRVLGADDKPVASARVAAVQPEALDALLADPSIDAMATTGADGAFRVAGLDEGPHVVVVDAGDSGIAVDAPRAYAGASGVTIRLRPAASARVRVVGPSGEKVVDASVRYRFGRPHMPAVVAARTDAQGVALLAGLDPEVPGTLTVESTTGIASPQPDWRPHDDTVHVGVSPKESQTDVVVHPDHPIEKGHNVLWCATSQLAWDAVAEAISKRFPRIAAGGRLPLGAPAPPALVERMNLRSFPHDAVDPKACVVVGGLASDGVVERIRAAWHATFGPDATPPVTSLPPSPDLAVGVAGIAKELPFSQPFHVHEAPIAFDGGAKVLRAWGIPSYEHGPGADLAAKQVTAFVPPGERRFRRKSPTALVELTPADPAERIVLAKVEPKASLEATWASVAEMLSTWKRDTVDPGSLLVVPTIRLDASQSFDAFAGAPIVGIPDSALERFDERVRFRLSEHGASIGAESAIVMSLGIHPELVFDGPFLVALRRADAKAPYLLLWVGNDALLERQITPTGEPLDAATLEPLVGRWTIDLARTADATLVRQYSLMEGGLEELGFPAGAKPAAEEILRRHREKNPEPGLEGPTWDVRLVVSERGHAALEFGYSLSPGEPDQRPDARQEGVVERFEGRPTLRFRSAPQEGCEPSDVRIPLTLRDGRIEIVEDQVVWVLQRK